jgi:magnesium transporter
VKLSGSGKVQAEEGMNNKIGKEQLVGQSKNFGAKLSGLRQLSRVQASRNGVKPGLKQPQEEPLHVETIEYNGLRWINIERPGNAEVAWMHANFDFNPLHLDDVTSRLQRPKIDDYEDYLFIVLHFPVHNKSERTTYPSEVDIFIGADYIVTVHEGKLRPLNKLFEQCKNNSGKRHGILGRNPFFALYHIIDVLVDYCFPIISKLAEKLEQIDEEIFKTSSSNTIYEISVLRRDIIAFRRIIKPQISIIANLERRRRVNEEEDMEAYFSDISDHISKIWDSLEEFKDVIEGLSATYDSLTSHRLNQIIKTLTVISVIMLPLTVITGFYGMNVTLPLSDHPWMFIFILSMMFFLAAAMLLFFRFRRWL